MLQAWRTIPTLDVAFRVVRAVAITWVILFVGLSAFQRTLLYPAGGFMQTPAQGGFHDVGDERLATSDGLRACPEFS